MSARPAELRGTWYPRTKEDCLDFFDGVPVLPVDIKDSRAAIVPHAGWVYSGAIAFDALRRVQAAHPRADLIIVFGGHLGPRHRPRLLIEGGWETPFGVAETPTALAQDVAMTIECELETRDDYYDDNAVEVQMPIVRHLWPDAKVLTLGVPPTEGAPAIGREVVGLAQSAGFKDIVVVGSTDLTHYGPNYDFRPAGRGFASLEWVKSENDAKMIEAIQALDTRQVLWSARQKSNACCPGAVAATIAGAKRLGAKRAAVTEYTTSYDVRPSEPEPTSFVGYVGMLLGS